jgi:FtsZ-binding cell division protein ZapB
MMSREHWNQTTITVIGTIMGLITVIGGAEWVFSNLSQKVAVDERDLNLLRLEVDQLKLDEAKHAAEEEDANRGFSKQLDQLQATWQAEERFLLPSQRR